MTETVRGESRLPPGRFARDRWTQTPGRQGPSFFRSVRFPTGNRELWGHQPARLGGIEGQLRLQKRLAPFCSQRAHSWKGKAWEPQQQVRRGWRQADGRQCGRRIKVRARSGGRGGGLHRESAQAALSPVPPGSPRGRSTALPKASPG